MYKICFVNLIKDNKIELIGSKILGTTSNTYLNI